MPACVFVCPSFEPKPDAQNVITFFSADTPSFDTLDLPLIPFLTMLLFSRSRLLLLQWLMTYVAPSPHIHDLS
jgi:hypothetical protein